MLKLERALALTAVLLFSACKGDSGEDVETPEQARAALDSALPELTSTVRGAIEVAATAGGGLGGQAKTRQHKSSLLASQNCPGGGTVKVDVESVGGGRYEGTATSSDCVVGGTTTNGTLTGSVTLLPGVTRFDISGSLTLSGNFNGTLTIHSLVGELSASGLCYRADVSVAGLRATVGPACGGATDAGVDAGQPDADAGQPGGDAGQPDADAGQPGADAGPPDADAGTPATCGNGSLDGPETCDDSAGGEALCPTSCAADNGCNHYTLLGSSAQCDARCVNQPINTCQGGDSCCPTSCTSATDSDCGSGLGLPCQSVSDCGPDLECYAPGGPGVCTKACTASSECGTGFFCATAPAGFSPLKCFQDCGANPGICPPGVSCQPGMIVEGQGPPVCAPPPG